MKDQIDILLQLQKIELETSRINSMLDDVPNQLDVLEGRLRSQEQVLADEEKRLTFLKQKYRACDADSQMNLNQVKKSQEKLSSVKTNKEYQAILKEIEELKTKNSRIEDEMLEYLDSIEVAEQGVDLKQREFSSLSDQVKIEKDALQKESAKGQKKLAELLADWKGISSKVEPELLKKYIYVKGLIKGTALAKVKNAVCQGCNLNIPPQMYNELQRSDRLQYCPHCQRMIYWENL